jgi:indolepyruvate decarboxylase
MNKKYTVGQYLVDRLTQVGLGHLFSIAGDYSIEWLNNYVEPSDIKVIQEVNELNAGYAADGYARLKGIGAICVTYSAGALCATNPIAAAYVERVPIVLINGTPTIKQTLTFEQTGFSAHHFISGRQTDLQVFEYITAAAVRIDNPDLAPMLIDYALTQCITERRPVYIELLRGMVDLSCEPPKGTLAPARTMSDPAGLEDSLKSIRQKLESAAKPLIWVGVEIDRLGLREKAEKLIRQLNIPYVTELMSKAILSENDAQFAGVFDGQASSTAAQGLANDSDFILALGVWLTDINTLGGFADFDKTAFVSLDSVKFGTYFSAQVSLEDVIDGLVAAGVSPKTRALPERPNGAVFGACLDDQITYQGFYDFIQPYITDDTIIGSDASMNYFGSLLLKVGAARGYIAQPSYSSIGYIAPAATGVCLAKERNQRVMVFTGDGGFQMSAQCLSTQTRFRLNPIIFVIDNGVYGVEQWLADASVFAADDSSDNCTEHSTGKPFYKECILHCWEYSKLADVFQCQGWKVGTYAELKDAIESALENATSPSIIQVVVPSKSIPDNAAWKEKLDSSEQTQAPSPVIART